MIVPYNCSVGRLKRDLVVSVTMFKRGVSMGRRGVGDGGGKGGICNKEIVKGRVVCIENRGRVNCEV